MLELSPYRFVKSFFLLSVIYFLLCIMLNTANFYSCLVMLMCLLGYGIYILYFYFLYFILFYILWTFSKRSEEFLEYFECVYWLQMVWVPQVDDYLHQLPIKALPGIGHVLGEKLKRRDVHTCGQLRMISKVSLFGKFFSYFTRCNCWLVC